MCIIGQKYVANEYMQGRKKTDNNRSLSVSLISKLHVDVINQTKHELIVSSCEFTTEIRC